MDATIIQWKTPPVEWGARVQDIAPPTAARLAPPPRAMAVVAVVTMATAELGGRVRRVIVRPIVQRLLLAVQCTVVENTAMSVRMVIILCTQNQRAEDQDLSNRTLRQSIFKILLLIGGLLFFLIMLIPCQPP
jgi:hypothetical protein